MQLMGAFKTGVALMCVVTLSACGTLPQGEYVSYRVWNGGTAYVAYSPTLESGGKTLDGGYRSTRPPLSPDGLEGWNGSGGSTMTRGSGHRVPERAQLSWRLPAKPGQELRAGDLVGPFTVAIRSRIPDRVLKRVRESPPAKLAIGVSVGVEPIKVRWVLKEASFVEGRREGGWRELERGGDW